MLEAGRELDALVAEKVMSYEWMDWPLNPEQPHLVPPGYEDPRKPVWWLGRSVQELVPNYSSDIAAAWQVAGVFDEVDLHKGQHGWLCRLERGDDDAIQMGEAFRAASAPLAICRAALDAVGSDG